MTEMVESVIIRDRDPICNRVPKHEAIGHFTLSNSDNRLCLGIELEAFAIAILCAAEISMTEYWVQDGLQVGLTLVDLFECIGNVAINHDGRLVADPNGMLKGK
jgi:hypothetical protein